MPGHARVTARSLALAVLLSPAAFVTGGCGNATPPTAVVTQLVEARRLAASLRLLVNKAADAEKSSVMAESDEASRAFAQEANDAARKASQQDLALKSLLDKLGYSPEQRLLSEFDHVFVQSRELDKTILELAVENSNLKAQRLSFGAAADAAAEVRGALDAAVAAAADAGREHVELIAAKIELSVDGMRLLQGPHIAESNEAAMTALETRMAAYEKEARRLLELLETGDTAPAARGADASFERFIALHREILTLSRRNTNVRSLELSLGQKRKLTAACDETLAALQDALEERGFRATR